MGYVKNSSKIKYMVSYHVTPDISMGWAFNYYLKTFIIGINYIFFVILSIIMLVYFKKNDIYEKKIKGQVMNIATPGILFIRGIDKIFTVCNDIYYYMINTRDEILSLKQDNFLLKQQLMGYSYTRMENEQLKRVINFTGANSISKYKVIRLNVLNDNVYSNMIMVAYGVADGLKEGDYVVDTDGNLIGRIINLQEHSSEILLITDSNSKISVRTEKSKINMILYGNKTKLLGINYVDGEIYNLKNNERVFVPSHNNVNNFYVGVLIKTKHGFKVRINVNFSAINYGVIVLQDWLNF
jgi:cell shape-determining protein MreC